FFGDPGTILIPRERAKFAVVVHDEGAAAEIVGAGLGDDGYRCAAGHALLGIEAVGGDVDFLDAFDRRHVDRVVRHRHQDVGRTVDAGIVGATLLAVDVGGQGAPGGIGD